MASSDAIHYNLFLLHSFLTLSSRFLYFYLSFTYTYFFQWSYFLSLWSFYLLILFLFYFLSLSFLPLETRLSPLLCLRYFVFFFLLLLLIAIFSQLFLPLICPRFHWLFYCITFYCPSPCSANISMPSPLISLFLPSIFFLSFIVVRARF